MRKIRRTKDSHLRPEAVKEKKLSTKTIWAIGIIALMALSGVGFYYGSREDLAPQYHGYKFSLAGQQYQLKYQGGKIPFTFHPTELEYLSADPEAISLLRNSPQVLIAFAPNSTDPQAVDLVRFRIGERLTEQGIAVGMGILEPDARYPLPVLSCANATAAVPVLEIRFGEEPGITKEQYCVRLIAANGREMAEFGERLEYSLLGVMQ